MAYLRAFGSWLPPRRVSNRELAPLVDATPEWILDICGIEERRYAGEQDTVTSIGLLAARDCLEKAGATAAELGMILVASGSSDRFCPGPASQIAAGLGLASTPALDIPVASAGSLIGLALAAQLAPVAGRVLVVGAGDHVAPHQPLIPKAKTPPSVFGDGAGRCPGGRRNAGFARIADSLPVYRWRFGRDSFCAGRAVSIWTGRRVILQVCARSPRHQRTARPQPDCCRRSEVKDYLLHQANLKPDSARVAASVKGASRAILHQHRSAFGNTSSASLLIAADEWHCQQTAPRLTGPLIFSRLRSRIELGVRCWRFRANSRSTTHVLALVIVG